MVSPPSYSRVPWSVYELRRVGWWAGCVEHKTQARLEIAHSRCQLMADAELSRRGRPAVLSNGDSRSRLRIYSVHWTVAPDYCRARFCLLHIRAHSNLPKRRFVYEISPGLELAIHAETLSPPCRKECTMFVSVRHVQQASPDSPRHQPHKNECGVHSLSCVVPAVSPFPSVQLWWTSSDSIAVPANGMPTNHPHH